MYAVIFRAEINELSEGYTVTAARLREAALKDYGCLQFLSCCEDNIELAISYWPDLASIQAWKNNADHLQAQVLGKSTWYRSYQVQIVEIIKDYAGPR